MLNFAWIVHTFKFDFNKSNDELLKIIERNKYI